MWKLKALGEAFVGLQTWLGFFDDDISNQLLTFNFLLLLSSTAMARKIRVFFFFSFFYICICVSRTVLVFVFCFSCVYKYPVLAVAMFKCKHICA